MQIRVRDIVDLPKEEIEKLVTQIGMTHDGFIWWVRDVYRRAARIVCEIKEVKDGPTYLNLLPSVKQALRMRNEVAQNEVDGAILVLSTMRVELHENKIRPTTNAELAQLLEEARKPKG
jgi:hypothetical protein